MTHFVPPQSVLVLLQDTLSALYAAYDLYMLLIFSKYFHFNWLSSNCKREKNTNNFVTAKAKVKVDTQTCPFFPLFFFSQVIHFI